MIASIGRSEDECTYHVTVAHPQLDSYIRQSKYAASRTEALDYITSSSSRLGKSLNQHFCGIVEDLKEERDSTEYQAANYYEALLFHIKDGLHAIHSLDQNLNSKLLLSKHFSQHLIVTLAPSCKSIMPTGTTRRRLDNWGSGDRN